MPRRLALLLALAFALAAEPFRAWLETPPRRPACVLEGRGKPPRHYLGCAGDPGPPRALTSDERLVLGMPIDPNTASARDLAFVPGLSRRLAAEVVLDRERNGPYRRLADLVRVRGIGPKRLEAASRHLAIAAP
jgi:competence protein ComEA